jgi:hypothetical protein
MLGYIRVNLFNLECNISEAGNKDDFDLSVPDPPTGGAVGGRFRTINNRQTETCECLADGTVLAIVPCFLIDDETIRFAYVKRL